MYRELKTWQDATTDNSAAGNTLANPGFVDLLARLNTHLAECQKMAAEVIGAPPECTAVMPQPEPICLTDQVMHLMIRIEEQAQELKDQLKRIVEIF